MKPRLLTRTAGLLSAVLIGLAAAGSALAQDPAEPHPVGDRLLAEDGDLLIYRSDDGRIKIKRAGEDEWVAVVDPDRNGRFFVWSGSDDWSMAHDAIDLADDLGSRVYGHVAPLVGDLRVRIEEGTELSEMELQSRRLARQLRSAEGDDRDRLEEELDMVLADIFDKKQDLRRERMVKLEGEVDEIREHVNERQENRAEIIDRRKQELLGEYDPLDW